MSLYDGLSVETAPVPELTPQPQPGEQKADSGWTANLKLMATHLHVHRGGKTARGRGKPKAGVPRAAVLGSSGGMETATVQVSSKGKHYEKKKVYINKYLRFLINQSTLCHPTLSLTYFLSAFPLSWSSSLRHQLFVQQR